MFALYVKRLSMSIGKSLGTTGNLNIRIHRDITGKIWFGVGCYMRKSKMTEYF
jgi:cytosine/uracil/thiamine/allantoin permease